MYESTTDNHWEYHSTLKVNIAVQCTSFCHEMSLEICQRLHYVMLLGEKYYSESLFHVFIIRRIYLYPASSYYLYEVI